MKPFSIFLGIGMMAWVPALVTDAMAYPADRHEKLYEWVLKECALEEPEDAALLARAIQQYAGKIEVHRTTWNAPRVKSNWGPWSPGHRRLPGDVKPNYEAASRDHFAEDGYWPHYAFVTLEEIFRNRFSRQAKLVHFELLALQTTLNSRIANDANYQKLLKAYKEPRGATREEETRLKEAAARELRALEVRLLTQARAELEPITRSFDGIRWTQLRQAFRGVQYLQELGFDEGARRLKLSLYPTFESQLSLWTPEKFEAVFGSEVPANRGSVIQRTITVNDFGFVRLPTNILSFDEARIEIHPLLGNPPVGDVILRATDEPPLRIGKISENLGKERRTERLDLENDLSRSRQNLENVQRLIPDYEEKLRQALDRAARSQGEIDRQRAAFQAADSALKKERAKPPEGAEADFRALQTVEAELRRTDLAPDSRKSLTERQQELVAAIDAAEGMDQARYERIRGLQLKVLDAAMPNRPAESGLAQATLDARFARQRLENLRTEAAAYQKEIAVLAPRVAAGKTLAPTERGSQVIQSLTVRWQDQVVYDAEQKAGSGDVVFRERLKQLDQAIAEMRTLAAHADTAANEATANFTTAHAHAMAKGELLPAAIRSGSNWKAAIEGFDFVLEVFLESFRDGGPPAALMEALYKVFEMNVFSDGKVFSSFDESDLRSSMQLEYRNVFQQLYQSKVWKSGNPAATPAAEREGGFGDPISSQRWLENTLGNPAKQIASLQVGHFLSDPKPLKTSTENAFWAHVLGVDHRFQPPPRFREVLDEMGDTDDLLRDRSKIMAKGLEDAGAGFLKKIAKDAFKELLLNSVEEHVERRPWIEFIQADLEAVALFPGWVLAMQKREAIHRELTGMIQARADSLDRLDPGTGLQTKVDLPFEKAGKVEVNIALAFGLAASSIELGGGTYKAEGGTIKIDAKILQPNSDGVLDLVVHVQDPRDTAGESGER